MVGGRGINGREHADVLQSAQMAGTRGFFSRPHAPTCVWQLQGGVNNVAMELDALGIHWRGEGVESEWKCCCPEKKSGSLPPFSIASRAGKHTRGRGGTSRGGGKK